MTSLPAQVAWKVALFTETAVCDTTSAGWFWSTAKHAQPFGAVVTKVKINVLASS